MFKQAISRFRIVSSLRKRILYSMLEPLRIDRTRSLTALVLGLALTPVAVLGAPSSSGVGWTQLKNNISTEVAQTMSDGKIQGMTVAVTRKGKLVLSIGYGNALKNGSNTKKMKRSTTALIGSTGKALISGPSVWATLEAKGHADPSTVTLYGPGGIFKNQYRKERRRALGRFENIAAIAITPSNKTYTWMRNGKGYVGKTRNLTAGNNSFTYSLPDGMTTRDIRAIAIAGSTSKVYTWWSNGGLTVGTAADLDRYKTINYDDKNKVEGKVKFPSGLNALNLVGVAIAKTNDQVMAWYDNGTVSSGTSGDLTGHFVNRSYKAPSHWSRYRINGMAISASNRVYTWYSNGKTSSGSYKELNSVSEPADYTRPPIAQQNYYPNITLGQVFAHKAGFQRNAGKGADKMFNKDQEALTYHDIHRYFLSTKPLIAAPGEKYLYSNHGFGIATLMVPAISGRTYRNYAINTYLKNIGVKGTVIPSSKTLRSIDANGYRVTSNGSVVPVASKDSTTGLAAGGWRSSAENVVRITNHQSGRWNWNQMDLMGWGKSSKGALSHSGKISGGMSYATIFPDGYIDGNGNDLSDVHVAVVVNTSTDKSLKGLANHIARSVPLSGIPSTYQVPYSQSIN